MPLCISGHISDRLFTRQWFQPRPIKIIQMTWPAVNSIRECTRESSLPPRFTVRVLKMRPAAAAAADDDASSRRSFIKYVMRSLQPACPSLIKFLKDLQRSTSFGEIRERNKRSVISKRCNLHERSSRHFSFARSWLTLVSGESVESVFTPLFRNVHTAEEEGKKKEEFSNDK